MPADLKKTRTGYGQEDQQEYVRVEKQVCICLVEQFGCKAR